MPKEMVLADSENEIRQEDAVGFCAEEHAHPHTFTDNHHDIFAFTEEDDVSRCGVLARVCQLILKADRESKIHRHLQEMSPPNSVHHSIYIDSYGTPLC
jgi:hypothetical protein